MIETRIDTRKMAAKALFLKERIRRPSPFLKNKTDVQHLKEIDHHFAIWQKKAGGNGGKQAFLKRLSADGLSPEQAKHILAPISWGSSTPLPAWVNDIEKIISFLPRSKEDIKGKMVQKCLDQYENTSGVEVALLPFLEYAEQKMIERIKNHRHLLADSALTNMLSALVKSLNRLCFQACYYEFQLQMKKNNPLFSLIGNIMSQEEKISSWYQHNQELLQGKWQKVLEDYPVLARLMMITISNWLENISDFARCLKDDMPKLETTFNDGEPLGKLTDIEADLSDVHHKGKTVWITSFSTGVKIVFKPRNLAIDIAWAKWIQNMEEAGLPLKLKSPKIVSGEHHGWAEFIEHKPLGQKEEADEFYFRAGVLLGTIYALGGNDFHYENVIASGAQPVLIDTETLLLHRVRPFDLNADGMTAAQKATDLLSDSVLRTGMLPMWRSNGKGGAFDWGALTGWDKGKQNLPVWQGKPLNVNQYEEQLFNGVEWVYNFLMDRKEQLLGGNSPLELFTDCQFRFLIRNTQMYGDILQHTTHPHYLKDGLAYSFEIERMASAYLLSAQATHFQDLWNIFQSERDALEERDIPIFYGNAEGLWLHDGMEALHPTYFMESACDRARSLIRRMDQHDKAIQLDLIKTSLSMHKDTSHLGKGLSSVKSKPGTALTVTDNILLAEATAIFEEIMDKRIDGLEDDFTWIVRQFDLQTQKMTLGQIGIGLYDGLIGLSVFMAALYRLTNREEIREATLSALRPFRESLHSSFNPFPVHRLPLGLGNGLSGIVRGLMAMGDYLQEDSLKEDALTMIHRMTPEQIDRDEQLDVLGGSAGLLIVLADLYHSHKDKHILDLAKQCGRHLLKRRVETESGHKVWTTGIENAPLTGLGHGAAGYAHALYQLWTLTKENAFHEGAMEALIYENSLYNTEHNNWPDLRKNPDAPKGSNQAFMAGWCSGAPGVGLARAGMFNENSKQAEMETLRNDIEQAVQFTLNMPLEYSDHVCCGHAGRIDFLIEASILLNRPNLLNQARHKMGQIIARKRKNGHYLLNSHDAGAIFNPSFFQGISGIGYQLLRCIAPNEIKGLLK